MSIYMKLRCELRGESPINESKCWSDVDYSLWSMALNTHEPTVQSTTELLSSPPPPVGRILMVIGPAKEV